MKKLALLLSLMLTLCACAPAAPSLTPTEPAPTESNTTQFTRDGFTLSIPNEYLDLLIVDTQREKQLFHVSEKASVEAAKVLFPDENVGGGFLFGIGRVNEAERNEIITMGIPGADIFARDEQGNYYVCYHPTDVQILRVGEYTDADWAQWGELCEWAAPMAQTFLTENPGLIPFDPYASVQTNATQFTNEGFTLSVPNEYVDLLIVNPSETEWNRSNLFHVSEKASVEAAKELWPDDPTMGGGFLFGIGRVNETQFNEMMAWGMNGANVFARDAENNYYICYRPTDVQLIRVDEPTEADWEQWRELCEWAAQAEQFFIDDNPGLTRYQRTYKDLDCALVHIAFWKEEYKLLEKDGDCVYTPGYPKSLPYVEQLLDDVLYFDLLTTEELNTDGHYIRLSVPGTLPHTSFDFFTDEGQQHIIRQNFDNTLPVYYVASRDGDFFPAGKVVADWLESLS